MTPGFHLQLGILSLREQARQKLGPKFDLRAFHGEERSPAARMLNSQVKSSIELKERQPH